MGSLQGFEKIQMVFLSVHRGALSGFRSITSCGSARNRRSRWATGSARSRCSRPAPNADDTVEHERCEGGSNALRASIDAARSGLLRTLADHVGWSVGCRLLNGLGGELNWPSEAPEHGAGGSDEAADKQAPHRNVHQPAQPSKSSQL